MSGMSHAPLLTLDEHPRMWHPLHYLTPHSEHLLIHLTQVVERSERDESVCETWCVTYIWCIVWWSVAEEWAGETDELFGVVLSGGGRIDDGIWSNTHVA